uniref:Knottins-like domain-containing protein n=1 Tax=Oryza punctata TaxID=4537 RepID=A0A0E0KN10_ORYPU
METMRKFFPAITVVLLLVVATEAMAPGQSGRPCETKSLRFEGFCMVEDNCANVCRTEGFVDGRCSTFVRNCICIKPC